MDIVSLDLLNNDEIYEILNEAQEFVDGKKIDYLGEKTIAYLFFEPSSRTHYSFEKAAMNLGCKTQSLDIQNSSVLKGETLYDTAKLFECLGNDALVIRHPENGYYKDLVGKINVPILNAGDGTGQHPSQSLLDLLTIKQEFGNFEGVKVVIVGDIKHSRVAHTNFKIMQRLGMEVYTSGPIEFKEEDCNYVDFESILPEVDVVMLLRVQHERHDGTIVLSKEDYHNQYGLNATRVKAMKENAIIMHPAPFNRNVEIADDVVECEQSRIFKQMKNGVYVRMALIDRVLRDE